MTNWGVIKTKDDEKKLVYRVIRTARGRKELVGIFRTAAEARNVAQYLNGQTKGWVE